MRWYRSAGFVAVVVLGVGLACSSHPSPSKSAAYVPSPEDRQHELLVAAELEVRNLEGMRLRESDSTRRTAMDRQITDITGWRDALLADLSPPGGARDESLVRRDMANLERALRASAATQPQVASPPPIARPVAPMGDDESLPPWR